MAYNITSESQLIDKDTIISGCNKLGKAANDFKDAGEKVTSISKRCDKKVISVDGQSLEPIIADMGTEISNVNEGIDGIAKKIAAEARKIYAAQKRELEEYKKKQKEKENS